MSFDIVLQYISLYGVKILGSIAIFIIGKWVAKKLSALINKIMQKTKIDETLSKFLANAINAIMLVFIGIAALSNLGVETTSFVAVLGAAGLAIGMAFKDTFSNLGAGVLIIVFKPFKLGDFVEIAGTSGSVEEVNLFSTFLTTGDNKQVIIPNSNTISGNITNYSAKPTRRVDMTFGIGYDDDLKLAKQILESLVSENTQILKEPKPFIAVSELAESSVNFVVRVWVKSADYWSVYHSMLESVKLEFDKKGISIPFPQLDINNKNK